MDFGKRAKESQISKQNIISVDYSHATLKCSAEEIIHYTEKKGQWIISTSFPFFLNPRTNNEPELLLANVIVVIV